MQKLLFQVLVVLLFIGLASCSTKQEKKDALHHYIPKDAEMTFKISNWNAFIADAKNNTFLKEFEKTASYFSFTKKKEFFEQLNPQTESLLSITPYGDTLFDYTLITKQNPEVFPRDSIKDLIVENLSLNGIEIDRNTIDGQLFFSAERGSIFIASTSQRILLEVLSQKSSENKDAIAKLFSLPNTQENSLILKSENNHDTLYPNFTSWHAVNILLSPEKFKAEGIALALDTIPQILNVFKGQNPQKNHAAAIIPINALGATVVTLNDYERFQNNLKTHQKGEKTTSSEGIFDSASEVGSVSLPNSEFAFLKSIDASATLEALAKYLTTESLFREVEIKAFSAPDLFVSRFAPFSSFSEANYMVQLEDFFVFVPTLAAAEEIIGVYRNGSTLQETAYYQQTASEISSSSSLMIFALQQEYFKHLNSLFPFFPTEEKNLNLKKFPLSVLQYSYDRNFAHVTFIAQEFNTASRTIAKGITERYHLNLKSPLLGNPQIFDSNGHNVIVQDAENVLHFISENGKILWTKNLGAPILGDVAAVDLYKNGNKQLAFTTKDALYILDRNGKDVDAFPVKFRDEVTQPLGIFDYDKNFTYRFAVTQDKNVLLYDKNAKIVKGFGFKSAKSKIAQPPVHIRMGNKDYVLIAESNGKLNILNRMGQVRVPVKKNFEFSDIPITSEDRFFVVISKDHKKERISESGETSSQPLDVGSYWFTLLNGTKATLDDNLLRINGKLVDLPIGIYSKPVLHQVSNKIYTGITEINEKKTYLFDANGKLLKGFPVYGSTEPSLSNYNSKGALSMVVQGDTNGFIVYTID